MMNGLPVTIPSPLSILESMAEPVFVQDSDLRWVYANAACGRLLSCPPDTLLGQSGLTIFADSSLTRLEKTAHQVLNTQRGTEQEATFQDQQGTMRTVSVSISPLRDRDGLTFLVYALRDVTHRTQAEQRLQQQARRERLLGTIAKHLLQSLNPEHLLDRSMEELRRFLNTDRVLFYSLRPRREGVTAEAVIAGLPTLRGQRMENACFAPQDLELYFQGNIHVAHDIRVSDLAPEQRSQLDALQVKAHLVIPVVRDDILWGLICVHHCRQVRTWQPWEVEALQDVATQISSAIAQADLYEQVRQLNTELEMQVQQRTNQLQQALDFEATLKRITDRVRDSLDETQILQTAVQELTRALGAKGSNTALYDLEQGTSTIYYEYNDSLPSYQGRVAQMEAFPEVYHQLLDGQYFQFCSKEPNPVRGHVAMLACPILDDRGVLGDLWLINGKDYGFDEQEIRLVQQVANQCAIAIRQARLYQAAQSQVKELEHINQLKDDFLSTVSHELRTPVTSMRVALQLLGVTLNQEFDLNTELQKTKAEQNRIARYYSVLREECEREISLINDLLDLQRLDGGNHPINPQRIDVKSWLTGIVNSFQERAHSRDQQLSLDIADALPILVSDQPSLERIFAELLNNACKYTPPGEHICITVDAPADDTMRFCVANRGVEIPPAELPRIFDKFYRVPSADPWKQGGTGLGLALVQKLLWHLGGEIVATSDRQETRFTVTVPMTLTYR